MKTLHIVPELNEANGVFVVAQLLARESGDAAVVGLDEGLRGIGDGDVEEVWVHGMWLPKEWAACRCVLKAGKRLVRMTHGSLSPIYLKYQSPFKKRLAGPIERWALRRCAKIVATCDAEKGWIEAYLGKRCPEIVVEDVKRFFDFSRVERVDRVEGEKGVSSEFRVQSWGKENSKLQTSNSKLNLLYLGRRHPLKGGEFLESAVRQLQNSTRSTRSTRLKIELKIVSNAFGEELEKVWDWCDVLVLPTLSENFGLVVAEALERGKRVITTDGAPVWEPEDRGQELGVSAGYGGRLLFLRGYRDGSKRQRVELLKGAIKRMYI